MSLLRNIPFERKRSVSHSPIFAFLIFSSFVLCLNLDPIDFERFDQFKDNWTGGDQAIECDEPSQCRDIGGKALEELDDDITQKSVWREFHVPSAPEYSVVRTYSFDQLGVNYCQVTQAQITVKYFMENAVAYTFPCVGASPPGSYCYLENQNLKVEWFEKTFEIDFNGNDDKKVELKILLLKGGYIILDKIVISHDGIEAPPGGCITTTTEDSTTTDTTDSSTTDTTETTGTYDPEGTNGETWDPLPSTSPMTSTTPVTTRATTTLPSVTGDVTEEEDSEENSSSTTDDSTSDGSTTTEISTSSDQSTSGESSTSSDISTSDQGSTELGSTTSSSTPTTTTTTRRTTSTTPSDDGGGLALKEILLYIVLPAGVVLLALLACSCFYGIRSYHLRVGKARAFQNLDEDPPSIGPHDNAPKIKVQNIDGATAFNPDQGQQFILARFQPSTPVLQTAPMVGNGIQYPINSSGSPTYNQINVYPQSPVTTSPTNAVLLNIPEYAYAQVPEGSPRSMRSSASTSRYPMYTGEYISGHDLPRMRRKLD